MYTAAITMNSIVASHLPPRQSHSCSFANVTLCGTAPTPKSTKSCLKKSQARSEVLRSARSAEAQTYHGFDTRSRIGMDRCTEQCCADGGHEPVRYDPGCGVNVSIGLRCRQRHRTNGFGLCTEPPNASRNASSTALGGCANRRHLELPSRARARSITFLRAFENFANSTLRKSSILFASRSMVTHCSNWMLLP